MARTETDREDLWAEVVALSSRVELFLPERAEPILIGRRSNGWWSIYMGQDVMLQFTADGRLRRAYRAGALFRTQGATLARLIRERLPTETVLRRHDLDNDQLAEFGSWMRAELSPLQAALSSRQATTTRFVSADVDDGSDQECATFLEAANRLLQNVLSTDNFVAPAIRGKP